MRAAVACGLVMAAMLSLVTPVRTAADTVFPGDSAAGEEAADTLYGLMHLQDLMSIMGQEGQALGGQLGRDYFPGRVPAGYSAIVDRLYDPARMDAVMQQSFRDELAAAPAGQVRDLIVFFDAAPGRALIEAELSAREDFLDETIEEEAQDAATSAAVEDPELFSLVEAYVEANDLIERNVSAALTTDYNFYLGLVDGGAYPMREDEIVEAVWLREDLLRDQTRNWIVPFLIHAYGDLDRDTLRSYVSLSESEAGQKLNAALFTSFSVVYDEIYHKLGTSISTFLMGEEI